MQFQERVNSRTSLGSLAKFRKATVSFLMSVRPQGKTRLPLDAFSWSLKICRENSIFIKIRQEKQIFYMKTTRHFWSYLAQFFLKWEMFLTNFVEEIKTHILFSITSSSPPPPRKSCHLWSNMETLYSRIGHRWQCNRARVLCMLGN